MLFQSPPYNTLPVFVRVTGNVTSLAEGVMDKAMTGRNEQQAHLGKVLVHVTRLRSSLSAVYDSARKAALLETSPIRRCRTGVRVRTAQSA